MPSPAKWPKRLEPLTPEQQRIRDEFMALWHVELPRRYGIIEWYNHGYPVWHRKRRAGRIRTLEIGAGLGGHIPYEDLTAQEYHALELRPNMAEELQKRFPECRTAVGDCQERLPFEDASLDRVLAIHVLEHLPNLPAALREIRRVLRTDGELQVVIPCEGGLFYRFCRNISARRIFERRFGQPYDWFVRSEHVNLPDEIEEELGRLFRVRHRSYFPLLAPVTTLNLCIGLSLDPA